MVLPKVGRSSGQSPPLFSDGAALGPCRALSAGCRGNGSCGSNQKQKAALAERGLIPREGGKGRKASVTNPGAFPHHFSRAFYPLNNIARHLVACWRHLFHPQHRKPAPWGTVTAHCSGASVGTWLRVRGTLLAGTWVRREHCPRPKLAGSPWALTHAPCMLPAPGTAPLPHHKPDTGAAGKPIAMVTGSPRCGDMGRAPAGRHRVRLGPGQGLAPAGPSASSRAAARARGALWGRDDVVGMEKGPWWCQAGSQAAL